MKIDRNTAIILATSTIIGLVGDTLIYSLGQSAGGSFKIHVPKGKELFQLVALGIVGGFIIDLSVKSIQESLKAEEEKKLDKLVAIELEKIRNGQVKGKNPQEILWSAAG